MVCLSPDLHLARLPAATVGVRRASLRRICRVCASAEEAPKRLSPLQKGGTLTGEKALGKDAAKGGSVSQMEIVDGVFVDPRWVDGRWDNKQFLDASGEVDWDAVIDAEMGRRALLEDSPTPSVNDAVQFDTSDIPWWAWVRRFHLPVAEKLNGRAAMLGYFAALVVEQFSGSGLLEQQNSFFGKVLLHITVFAVLLIREVGDIEQYKNLLDEAFFYDRQWNASWEGKVRPSEMED
ncbi:hypothetical protein BSKO_01373 [Bryopsis sp. KO-2023]|nr:hypothetical protein BSKO_01373 [Bryopsis sp. KO-2023]